MLTFFHPNTILKSIFNQQLNQTLTALFEFAGLLIEASTSLWEQDAASCFTLLLLILADAPLVVDNLDKQVVPGCSCALFCFADGWLRSSSHEPIVAARLAKRPLLPIGVSLARALDVCLGGETDRSFDWRGDRGTHSEGSGKKRTHILLIKYIEV